MIKTNGKGSLIVISGPSGAGKGTVIQKLVEKNDNVWLSVSCTSRPIRSNDIEGVTYYFLTKEAFEEKIKNNEFLEYAEYNGNYYGTPKAKIKEKLDQGMDVILEIEVQGALYIKKNFNDAIFIFIMPPSMEELRDRLIRRRTDSKEKIISRFKTAYNEINEVTKYNYVVVNDDVDKACYRLFVILEQILTKMNQDISLNFDVFSNFLQIIF